ANGLGCDPPSNRCFFRNHRYPSPADREQDRYPQDTGKAKDQIRGRHTGPPTGKAWVVGKALQSRGKLESLRTMGPGFRRDTASRCPQFSTGPSYLSTPEAKPLTSRQSRGPAHRRDGLPIRPGSSRAAPYDGMMKTANLAHAPRSYA